MRKIRGASLRIGLALFVVYTLVSLVLIGNAYAAKDKTNDITPTMLRGRVLVTYVSGDVTAVDIIDGSGFTVTIDNGYFEIVPDNPFASAPSVFVNLGDAISDDGFSQARYEYSFNAWADRIAIANSFPTLSGLRYFDFLAIGEAETAKVGKSQTTIRGRIHVVYVDGDLIAAYTTDGSGFTVTKYTDYFEIVPDNPFASAPSVFVNLGDAISDDGFSQASSEYSFNAWADRIAIANTFPGLTFWTYFDFLAIGETQ